MESLRSQVCLVEVVDLRRTLCALRLVINFSLASTPRDGAPSDRLSAYLRTVSASRMMRVTTVQVTPRHAPLSLRAHHFSTRVIGCTRRETRKSRPARAGVPIAPCVSGKKREIFCTKTAQCVYAQCDRHPPFTHRRGEPVTFFAVRRAIVICHHTAKRAVKQD